MTVADRIVPLVIKKHRGNRVCQWSSAENALFDITTHDLFNDRGSIENFSQTHCLQANKSLFPTFAPACQEDFLRDFFRVTPKLPTNRGCSLTDRYRIDDHVVCPIGTWFGCVIQGGAVSIGPFSTRDPNVQVGIHRSGGD